MFEPTFSLDPCLKIGEKKAGKGSYNWSEPVYDPVELELIQDIGHTRPIRVHEGVPYWFSITELEDAFKEVMFESFEYKSKEAFLNSITQAVEDCAFCFINYDKPSCYDSLSWPSITLVKLHPIDEETLEKMRKLEAYRDSKLPEFLAKQEEEMKQLRLAHARQELIRLQKLLEAEDVTT